MQNVVSGRQTGQNDLGEGSARMMETMVEEMPLASLASIGGLGLEKVKGIVRMLNND